MDVAIANASRVGALQLFALSIGASFYARLGCNVVLLGLCSVAPILVRTEFSTSIYTNLYKLTCLFTDCHDLNIVNLIQDIVYAFGRRVVATGKILYNRKQLVVW